MTRQIRQLGIGLMVCFAILFLQLNRLSVVDAKHLNENPNNTREILRDFNQPRGTISTADGTLVARSVKSEDGRFELQRQYPEGPLYGPITGYFSFTLGSSGVEKTYNDELAGRTLGLSLQDVGDLFVDKDRVGNVTLTLRDDLQRLAAEQLGDREGAVVALDPRTGAILAMVGFPSFDPNVLADHDTAAASAAQKAMDADPEKPRLARSFQDRFFPGSTFKIVTATAALTSGTVKVDSPRYPVSTSYTPPGTTRPIRNFGGESCGGDLLDALRVSCNSVFSQMGVDTGPDAMIRTAEAFGFNDEVPIDLPGAARSVFPTDFTRNVPALAQSSIGQNDVSASPLQMAMVAGAVANGGKIMRPHVLQDVTDSDGNVVDRYDVDEWREAMDTGTAAQLRDAMRNVVASGTATRMQLGDGFDVGGKTGTAQLGVDPPRAHAWIIGWAGREGSDPSIAVAVLVEGQPEVSSQTGGRVAAPIAKALLQAYFASGADAQDER